MYADLREYLHLLEIKGKLHKIEVEVDKDWEIAAVCRNLFRKIPANDRPALMFQRVKGFAAPVVAGALGASRQVYALALGTEPEDILDKWVTAQDRLIEPTLLSTGPCQENRRMGDAVDLTALPVPIWTVEHDPGPFITSPYVCTKDPQTHVQNVGTYRVQVKGRNKAGLMAGRKQDGMVNIAKWEAMHQPAPIAIAIGSDPVIGAVSVSKIPYGVAEFSMAGGLRGAPVELVKCLTVPLEVPATAEIVIEGTISPGVRAKEGPFGEYTGYMGSWGNHTEIDVTCITHRNNYIYQAFISQMPPSESSLIRGIGREVPLFKHLKYDLGLPVKDLCYTESGGSGAILIISIAKQYPGQARQIASAAWGRINSLGKYTIVVDDDIDIHNSFAVQWALSFRVQPDRDIHIAGQMSALGLDPSVAPADVPQHDPSRLIGSRVFIDGTRKHDYPPLAVPPEEHMDFVKQNWGSYGF